MREVFRETFDELWIIDVQGAEGPRSTENVFAIRTPVAIAVGVRYGPPKPDVPAIAHYARIDGNRREKLDALSAIDSLGSIDWTLCPDGWTDPLVPPTVGAFSKWPLVIDLFPWQGPGVKV